MLTNTKVGVFVDAENINRNGGYGMLYCFLRKFACRDGAEPVRLNTYIGFDRRMADRNPDYRKRTRNYFSKVRDIGFKLVEKEVKWYIDDEGNEFAKANADLDMAVDLLNQSEKLDRVLLATGDGDFVKVVSALQNKGCRVEIIAFDNVSSDLKNEADMFISGYLIPNLLPVNNETSQPWGEIGSRVRGVCYHFNNERNFGFMRFLKRLDHLWVTDSREEDSPYVSAFFRDDCFRSNSPDPNEMTRRNNIYEFTLEKSNSHPGKLAARDIEKINRN